MRVKMRDSAFSYTTGGDVQSGNSATCTLDGFMEMARFTISFEEAKAFKASRNQGIRKNEWHDLTVAVGIRTKA